MAEKSRMVLITRMKNGWTVQPWVGGPEPTMVDLSKIVLVEDAATCEETERKLAAAVISITGPESPTPRAV